MRSDNCKQPARSAESCHACAALNVSLPETHLPATNAGPTPRHRWPPAHPRVTAGRTKARREREAACLLPVHFRRCLQASQQSPPAAGSQSSPQQPSGAESQHNSAAEPPLDTVATTDSSPVGSTRTAGVATTPTLTGDSFGPGSCPSSTTELSPGSQAKPGPATALGPDTQVTAKPDRAAYALVDSGATAAARRIDARPGLNAPPQHDDSASNSSASGSSGRAA